jgi:plasmid stabilization system protein ParE
MAGFSDDAIEDLRNIRETIAEDSPRLAREKIVMLIELCQLLDVHPGLGTKHSALYRRFSKERWIIIYRPGNDGVFVQRIFDGSRDWQSRI